MSTSDLLPTALVALPLVLVLRGEDEELRFDGQRVEASIEEEGGRGADARLEALLLLLLDDGVELAGVHFLEHLRSVEPQRLRVLLEVRVVEFVLVPEQLLAHLPELAAQAGEPRASRGLPGIAGGGGGERLLTKTNLSRPGLEQRGQRPLPS